MTASTVNRQFEPGTMFQLVPVTAPRDGENAQGEPFRMLADLPDVANVKQAAQAVGMSQDKMRQLIAAGEIGSFRVGRCIRVPKSALLAFIDRGGSR